jgi:hypothetical protein
VLNPKNGFLCTAGGEEGKDDTITEGFTANRLLHDITKEMNYLHGILAIFQLGMWERKKKSYRSYRSILQSFITLRYINVNPYHRFKPFTIHYNKYLNIPFQNKKV